MLKVPTDTGVVYSTNSPNHPANRLRAMARDFLVAADHRVAKAASEMLKRIRNDRAMKEALAELCLERLVFMFVGDVARERAVDRPRGDGAIMRLSNDQIQVAPSPLISETKLHLPLGQCRYVSDNDGETKLGLSKDHSTRVSPSINAARAAVSTIARNSLLHMQTEFGPLGRRSKGELIALRRRSAVHAVFFEMLSAQMPDVGTVADYFDETTLSDAMEKSRLKCEGAK